jgi:hypothetical protein
VVLAAAARTHRTVHGSAQIVLTHITMTVGYTASPLTTSSPGRGGQQGVSMAKGVMRFVGGGPGQDKAADPAASTVPAGQRWFVVAARGTLIVHQNHRLAPGAPRPG